MGVVWAPESAYQKELAKWNVPRPYAEFPKMVYMAHRSPKGQIIVQDAENPGWAQRCQRIVNDEGELQTAFSQGWSDHPEKAISAAKKAEERISDSAAERYHAEQRMGELARREAAAKDAALSDGVQHVPEIPETPLPPKVAPAVVLCGATTAAGNSCKFKALKGATRCQKHSD